MSSDLRQFKERAFARVGVREAYEELDDEFSFLAQILSARTKSGLTQAQVAARIGTTQSAVARLESGAHRHSPSIATLQRYARALGYRLEVTLVKDRARAQRPKAGMRKA